MEMGNIFIHIGRHKSGTKSLQAFLSANQLTLRSVGFMYPNSMRVRENVGHHYLAHCLMNNEQQKRLNIDLAALKEEDLRFAKEIEGADNLLLSSEAFQLVKPGKVAERFGAAARVIVYIREQMDYLVSSYVQHVQASNYAGSLWAFARRRFGGNYQKFLMAWESAFPDGALIVRIYNRTELKGGDIREDFLETLGLGGERQQFIFEAGECNPSIGGALLEFKRRLNLVGFDSAITSIELYKILEQLAVNYPHLTQGACWEAGVPEFIDERYEDSNRLVCERYFPGRARLFERKSVFYTCAPPAATLSDVADSLNEASPGLGSKLFGLISGA